MEFLSGSTYASQDWLTRFEIEKRACVTIDARAHTDAFGGNQYFAFMRGIANIHVEGELMLYLPSTFERIFSQTTGDGGSVTTDGDGVVCFSVDGAADSSILIEGGGVDISGAYIKSLDGTVVLNDPNASAAATEAVTIDATGQASVTPGTKIVQLSGDGGVADVLSTIVASTGSFTAGDELILTAADAAVDITADDATGGANVLVLAGDFTLDHSRDTLRIVYDGSRWLELSRSNNQ